MTLLPLLPLFTSRGSIREFWVCMDGCRIYSLFPVLLRLLSHTLRCIHKHTHKTTFHICPLRSATAGGIFPTPYRMRIPEKGFDGVKKTRVYSDGPYAYEFQMTIGMPNGRLRQNKKRDHSFPSVPRLCFFIAKGLKKLKPFRAG